MTSPNSPFPQSKIGLFVVDDIPLIIDGVKLVISAVSDINFIGSAENSREAVTKIYEGNGTINVVLIDLNLKEKLDANPYEVCKMLLTRFPKVKFIAFTIYEGIPLLKDLQKLGVHGYLCKKYDGDELITAIRSVASGQNYFQEDSVPSELKGISNEVLSMEDLWDELRQLTERELETVKYITKGLSAKEIAKEMSISPNTVNIHRNKAYDKLGIKTNLQLIKRYSRVFW